MTFHGRPALTLAIARSANYGRLPTAVVAPVAAVSTYLAPGMHFPVHPATWRFSMRMVHTMICRSCSQVALSVVCLVFMSTGAPAQDTPERPAFSTAEANTVRLASELEAFGLEQNDSFALVTAVHLYDSLLSPVLQREQDGPEGEVVDRDFLLDRASASAPNDNAIQDVVDLLRRNVGTKGQTFPQCRWRYYCYAGWCSYEWVCW